MCHGVFLAVRERIQAYINHPRQMDYPLVTSARNMPYSWYQKAREYQFTTSASQKSDLVSTPQYLGRWNLRRF